jgi:hypothetical protein
MAKRRTELHQGALRPCSRLPSQFASEFFVLWNGPETRTSSQSRGDRARVAVHAPKKEASILSAGLARN